MVRRPAPLAAHNPDRRARRLLFRFRLHAGSGQSARERLRLRRFLLRIPRPPSRTAARRRSAIEAAGLPPESRPGGQPRCRRAHQRPHHVGSREGRNGAGPDLALRPHDLSGRGVGRESRRFFTSRTIPTRTSAALFPKAAAASSPSSDGRRESVPDPQARDTMLRSKLDWSEPGSGEHADMLRWYRDLIALRRRLHGRPRVNFSEGERWLRMEREDVSVICNLSDAPRSLPARGIPRLVSKPEIRLSGGAIQLPPDSVAIISRMMLMPPLRSRIAYRISSTLRRPWCARPPSHPSPEGRPGA